jgi:Ca-activated chloride channel homolog
MIIGECPGSTLGDGRSRLGKRQAQPIRHSRRGGMLPMVAICLPLFIIAAAFAVDVAYMQLTRTELRTATDAAARAGAKTLSMSQNQGQARQAAVAAAAKNKVAGVGLKLTNDQIQIGVGAQTNDTSRFNFTPGGTQPNAVRVTGRRTASSAAGPVGLLLGRMLGVTTFEPISVATSTQLDRDICLVVDRSGSMMESVDGSSIPGGSCSKPNMTKSRWGALYTAVNAFVQELDNTLQEEQCALVSYSSSGSGCGFKFTTSDINAPLDFNYQEIRNEMNDLSSRPVQGNTAIGAGIDNGVKVLTSSRARPFAVRTMVVMTDGLHNSGGDPVAAAQKAAKKNITINTVTFSKGADVTRMRKVAEATGGKHFHAANANELEAIFREIASTLPVMLTE